MKKITRENFRVEVYPEVSWFGDDTEQGVRQLCEDIKQDIMRHVDNIKGVYVESDKIETCEYCGYGWSEDSDTYNGGCCDKDEKNNPNPEVE